MEYPEEEEYIQTWLEGVFKYSVVTDSPEGPGKEQSLVTCLLVYSTGAGVVPKGRRRQRKFSFPTIPMHAAAICAFTWTRQYSAIDEYIH